MRFLMMLVVALMLSASVHAVGMGVPEKLRGTQVIDGDESNTLEANVLLQGGAAESEVTFFIEVNSTGLTANGENPKYERDITLAPYEHKDVTVKLKGLKDGSYLVTWGVVEHNDGSGFPVESRVDKTTVVKVKDVDEPQVTVPVTTGSTTRRGGGGGGGAVAPATATAPVATVPEKGTGSSGGDAVVADVGSSDGGIAQGSVFDGSESQRPSVERSEEDLTAFVSKSHNGEILLMMIIICSVLALVLSGYSVLKIRSEDS